jgi:hypothetical protein
VTLLIFAIQTIWRLFLMSGMILLSPMLFFRPPPKYQQLTL